MSGTPSQKAFRFIENNLTRSEREIHDYCMNYKFIKNPQKKMTEFWRIGELLLILQMPTVTQRPGQGTKREGGRHNNKGSVYLRSFLTF